MAKKDKEDDYRGEGVNPNFIYRPNGVRLDGSLRTDTSLFVDGRIQGTTLPISLNPHQTALMRTGAILGENLVDMPINTVGDARNFFIGVNNIASQVTMNKGLLGTMQTASDLAMAQSKVMARALESVSPIITAAGLRLDTSHTLYRNEAVRLSESVTTVLAYGQAIQNQFSAIIPTNGMTAIRDASISLHKTIERNHIYVAPETITSPFVYEPKKIKTEKFVEVLPEIKKELPVKTSHAIELMEHAFDPDTKNDDTIITTTIAELKRAVKNIQSSMFMVVQQTTHKVEITSMPILQIKDANESSVMKNKKKITLPKFPATEWNDIQIRFITDNDVYIKAGQKTVTADFEGLGFRNDKTGKPNTAWHFLLGLAKNNGQTAVIESPIPDSIKQQKKVISERLKTLFKNDTDPFNDFSEDNTYRMKIKLLPPVEHEKIADRLGVDEYLDETMTSSYLSEE